MRKGTVKFGLYLLLAGVVTLILATFYHGQIAWLLFFAPGSETMFVYLGFFWGGVLGCLGILVAITGLLRSAGPGPDIRLAPAFLLLAAAVICYLFLLYSSFTRPAPPKLAPGETITI
jgi:hypothetical protein